MTETPPTARPQGDAPVDFLALALAAARGGNLDEARRGAERGLAQPGADTTPFHAFLGMIFAQQRDHDRAAEHLRAAHRVRPGDVTIACNLIAVLTESDRLAEALAIATPELAASDASLRVARYRGFLAQSLDQFDDAVAAYERVLSRAPDDFESWNNLGNARAGLGDHAGAVEALGRAAALDRRAAPVRLNLAAALAETGRVDEADAALRETLADFPDDWRPAEQLYRLRKTHAKGEDALAMIEEAARRAPDRPDLQLLLGVEYSVARRGAEAERAFEQAIALDPLEADAYLSLAIQYEHANREDLFAPLIARARAARLPDGAVAFIDTLDLRRAGRFADALTRLGAVPAAIEPPRAAHIRATLLDRLGRPDEAYPAFTEANRLMAESGGDPLARAAGLRAELAAEIARLTPEWRASWRSVEPIDDGHDDPVFLVGFPRSGTTLLDTLIMGHPQCVVMEEQPPLNLVHEAIGGMAALPAMDAAAVAEARNRYFTEAARLAPLAPGKLLVDKSPLFLYKLPLIRRLFPRARVILALRHPCDVVLSCLMSNFRLNSAMANFLTLEDAAAFYDLAFSHWTRAETLFPVDRHTIVYERLVEDVEGQIRPLFDWLGIDWRAEALDHQSTAKARGLITTASYAQVAEPIYNRASGRWLRYREHLAPALDTLAPWAMAFGYGDPREEPLSFRG